MRPLASPELLTAPAAVSSISNQEPNKGQTCVQYLRNNNPRLRLNVISSEKSQPDRPRTGDHSELRGSSENTVGDVCGRHFLFDPRWRNGVYCRNNLTDDALMKPILPLVFRDYGVHRSHNLNRFSHRKQLSYRMTKPCTFGSFEEYDLPTAPSVLLTVTTPPIRGRRSITFTESSKNRSRIRVTNRVHNLLTVRFNNTTQSYPDPVLGAPPSFVQRISEISSLQEETVRQEKLKNLKKYKRQET
ncbi:uncharacterized protein si:ch211-171b20.3 [Colossoma macropomum]|uniref:uncharacterized protein si:ch211-171b20.3 n=1 Tax=Colossoma macropomum TaxID=42526 RepID=UPI0018652DD0|nr:uncharacterized protein si:ch211-171b20.3 [Colossoma macropomum]